MLIDIVPFLLLQLVILWLVTKHKRSISQVLLAQQALAQSNAQLEQADRVKNQFLSVASHELRTPVTSIHGYLQLLMRRLTKQSVQNPEMLPIRDALITVDAQAQRLTDLVNDLLDLTSLRSGKMSIRLARCDLGARCREVVEEQYTLTSRVINIQLSTDPVVVYADARRVTQVVSNLVGNALKYSPEDTRVRVEVVQRADKAILTVHNEGAALSEAQQVAIFEPFYRSPDIQPSATPGWGLGLALSKEIVDQHHGHLWVESSQGKGTTFFVALPLCTDSACTSPLVW